MKKEWGLPITLAIGLHLGLIALLVIVSTPVSYRLNTLAQNSQPVVHAAVVNSTAVATQMPMKAIEVPASQQPEVHQQEMQEIKKVKEQHLAEVKVIQQKTEQQRLAQIKAAQLALRKAQAEQQHRAQLKVEALKKQQEKAHALALQKQQQRQQKIAAEKQKQAELAASQAALQQQLLQQQIANEQKQLQQAQQMQGLIDQYRARILMAIANQWLIPDDTDPTISCVFSIDLTPAGVVSHVQLVKSSGNSALDRAAETAIYKASPLPVPQDSAEFSPFQHFTLKMRPEDVKR